MSKGPENRFRESVHRLMPKDLPYHVKMNNPWTGGVFDDWYSGDKADIWVEYKWMKNPLSPLQMEWGKARLAEGRRVFVVAGNETGGMLYKTPESWEYRVGGTHMTKAELAQWLVDQTMEKPLNVKKTGGRGKRHGKRIQKLNHRSADI